MMALLTKASLLLSVVSAYPSSFGSTDITGFNAGSSFTSMTGITTIEAETTAKCGSKLILESMYL